MLKKRSSSVCRKTGLMSDHISLPSPTKFINRPTVSSPIPSSGNSTGFFLKGFSGTDAAAVITSPTSILENKPFCAAAAHNFIISRANSNTSSSVTKLHPWDGEDSKVVGLGIVEALSNGKKDKQSSNPESRMVLFGSQLKVQIPCASRNCDSHCLVEYGVKNKSSQLAMALLSPARSCFSAASPASAKSSPPAVLCLSPSEMKLSEDYTRVISHGPNPKTIHIFDTCNGFNTLTTEISFSVQGQNGYPSDDFLTFCHSCRKKLGQGKDIFMYRGEKAFCSHECRNREMLADDEMEDAANCGPLAPP